MAFDAATPPGTEPADVTVEGLDMGDDHVAVGWPEGTTPHAAWSGVLARTREVVASEVAAMRAVGVPVDDVVVTGGWAHLPSVLASRVGIAERTTHVAMAEPGTTGVGTVRAVGGDPASGGVGPDHARGAAGRLVHRPVGLEWLPMTDTATRPEDEVVRICRELIRIDTSNYGDGSGPGEAAAAEYVVDLLREVGLEPQTFESDPGRVSVAVRIPGADRDRGALCVHGHLDVVPANAADWSVDPFAGEERDGCVWGRGAVDMKDMDAMMLAAVRHLARTGTVPPRDLVVVFFADEEAGGTKGSHFMVAEHPEVFEGVTEAISEVGGYSVTVTDRDGQERRTYLLQTAEKGIVWLRLTAHGRAGHGSVPNDENAIVRLAEAISRIAAHKWPREFIPSVRTLLDGLSEITGTSWSDEDLDELLEHLGGAQGFVRGTLQDTSNVTMLDAGYKHNVIPQHASANVDCRFLPGHEEELLATIARPRR